MKIISILFFLLFTSGAAFAQEVQVPFNSSGSIQVVNQDLEKKLDLFPTYPHFLEARLYREPDSSYILEITSFENGQLVKDRLPKSASAVALLREDVDARLGPQAPMVKLDQKGRTSLLVSSVVLSLVGYGTLIPVAFNMSDARQIAGTDLLMAGGSFLLASTLTSQAEVTTNEASLAGTGGLLGIGHGWLLTYLVGGQNADYHAGAAISVVTSVGEFLGGYYLARNLRMTGGTASVIALGGVFGGLDGLGISVAAIPTTVVNPPVSVITGLTLAGSLGGYYGGYLLTKDHPYSEGDATVLWLAAALGGAIPLANLPEAGVNDHVALPLLSIAGSIAATIAVHDATRFTNFTQSQALNIVLATAAGGLALAGVSLLAKGNEQTTVALASIGTVGGFCLAFATTPKGTQDNKTTGALQLQFNPSALLATHIARSAPFAGFSYTF